MVNIALIDDRLNKKYIVNNGTNEFYTLNNGVFILNHSNWSDCMTHATMCLTIVNRIFREYNLTHIQIMEDYGQASVDDLILALGLCTTMDLDIINLSIGSTKLSDHILLRPVLTELNKNGTIVVAAFSNDGYRTVPASMGIITGVAENLELPGEFTVVPVEKNIMGIDFYANYDITGYEISKNTREVYATRGNSLAAPVVTAKIAKAIYGSKNKIIDKTMAIQQLLGEEDVQFVYKKIRKNNKNRALQIKLYSQYDIVESFFIQVMNSLAFDHSIEAICLSNIPSIDLRMISLESINNTTYIHDDCFTNTDLILIYEKHCGNQRFSTQMQPDADILINKDCASLVVSENGNEIHLDAFSPELIAETIENLFFI